MPVKGRMGDMAEDKGPAIKGEKKEMRIEG